MFFDDKVITNLFAIKDLIFKVRVEFDFMIQNVFKFQVGYKFMNFVADDKGMYILDGDNNQWHNQTDGYAHREVERSKRTQKVYHQLAAPSVVAFKSLLRKI